MPRSWASTATAGSRDALTGVTVLFTGTLSLVLVAVTVFGL